MESGYSVFAPPRRVAPGRTPEPDGVRRDSSAGSGRLDRSGRPLRAHRIGSAGPAPSPRGQLARHLAVWAGTAALRSRPGVRARCPRCGAAQGSGSGVRAARASSERTPGRAAGRGLLALPPPPAPRRRKTGRAPALRRGAPLGSPSSVSIPASL